MACKKGQVWVETVIYTLIGLTLIGLVLAIATPKINELQDKAVIEQTIDSMSILDSKITDALSAPGNVRVVEFNMKRGKLHFDTAENNIVYEMDDSRVLYSEPGVSVQLGKIEVMTEKGAKKHKVFLGLSYGSYNLTFEGDEGEDLQFTQTSIPYKFSIENKGFVNGKNNIDISEVS